MRAVNLSETDQRILKASTAKFTYDEVKKTLKRSYGDHTYNSMEIKPEQVFQTSKLGEKPMKGQQGREYSNS